MDQKNTIVKCTTNPTCLFNHNGICDNYVITIGADGSCQEYVETEKPKRQMSDHLCDISCVAATYAEDGELYCSLIQGYPERPLRCSAYDDGGCDCPDWDKNIHGCALPKCCWS